jgi:hypothetical protein
VIKRPDFGTVEQSSRIGCAEMTERLDLVPRQAALLEQRRVRVAEELAKRIAASGLDTRPDATCRLCRKLLADDGVGEECGDTLVLALGKPNWRSGDMRFEAGRYPAAIAANRRCSSGSISVPPEGR